MSAIDSSVASVLAAQQFAVQSNIATAVAAKALDVIEQQGQAAVELLDGAVQFSKEAGKGDGVDVQA
ncbi:MAG: hypothetical protein CMJ64_13840 [Planctomycetaceae bacterium]|nr:hypothetical protein [Planctomycetaceae bacterium]